MQKNKWKLAYEKIRDFQDVTNIEKTTSTYILTQLQKYYLFPDEIFEEDNGVTFVFGVSGATYELQVKPPSSVWIYRSEFEPEDDIDSCEYNNIHIDQLKHTILNIKKER